MVIIGDSINDVFLKAKPYLEKGWEIRTDKGGAAHRFDRPEDWTSATPEWISKYWMELWKK